MSVFFAVSKDHASLTASESMVFPFQDMVIHRNAHHVVINNMLQSFYNTLVSMIVDGN